MARHGLFLLLLFSSACSGASQHEVTADMPPANRNPNPRPSACSGQAEHVKKLYAEAPPPAGTTAGKEGGKDAAKQRELQDEILAANVAMVLSDCERDPARVLPCITSASAYDDLERNCLLPLDDAGQAEHKRFGSPRAR